MPPRPTDKIKGWSVLGKFWRPSQCALGTPDGARADNRLNTVLVHTAQRSGHQRQLVRPGVPNGRVCRDDGPEARLQCHLELHQLSRASNTKPRLVILTGLCHDTTAQGRNVAFLGVIQGGSGRPDRRVPVVTAGHLLQAWVGGATQSARTSVAVILIEAIQLAHSWRCPRSQLIRFKGSVTHSQRA